MSTAVFEIVREDGVIEEVKDATESASRRTARVRKIKEEKKADSADDEQPRKRKSWPKYQKRYKPQWEQLELFSNWLRRTPDHLLEIGKPEAYCILCNQCLRAHKSDLTDHAKSKKHQDSWSNACNQDISSNGCKAFIESYVPDSEDQSQSDRVGDEDGPAESATKKTKGRPSKSTGSQFVIKQINTEFEETMEKIKLCEYELHNLKVKKARLEFELDYYSNN